MSSAPKPELASPAPLLSSGFSGRILAALSRETSSGRFIPEMDGLRFVAIGMVVLFHLNGYLMAKSAANLSFHARETWLAQIAVVGFRGVELFFVISGFILGLPFAARYLHAAPTVSLKKYYLRRLTRLEPPYIVTVMLLFLLAILIQGKSVADLYPHLGASLLYLHNLVYGTSSPVIGVAWSLEIEVQFYLLVPVLTLLFAIKDRWLRRAGTIGLVLLTQAAESVLIHSSRASLSIFAYLQFFLIGFVLADLFLTDWKEAPSSSFAWDMAALVGWPALFLILHFDAMARCVFPYAVLLLYCAAFRGRLTNYIFTNPWITAIGGMCYSIYLIHYEVISLLGRITRTLGMHLPYWAYLLLQLALLSLPLLIICGTYFLLLEKPCMRRDWPQRLRMRLQGLLVQRAGVLAETESAE